MEGRREGEMGGKWDREVVKKDGVEGGRNRVSEGNKDEMAGGVR